MLLYYNKDYSIDITFLVGGPDPEILSIWRAIAFRTSDLPDPVSGSSRIMPFRSGSGRILILKHYPDPTGY